MSSRPADQISAHIQRRAGAPGRIYLSPPHLDGRERELLGEAFDSNWITTLGPQVDAFEREMARKLGIRSAAALSSGTAAIHLALKILGIQRDDEVLCSDLTFAATANPIVYCGARPVFIDCDPGTWNMDPALLEEELSQRAKEGRLPRAVIVVDLYGQCADYGCIQDVCGRYSVPIIEDAAESLGATHRGRAAGTFGEIGVLSFNGNKIITTSGGGMLLSDNEEHARKARFLASQARDSFPHYEHSQIGYNYRLSNLLAAVGRAQLENLDRKVERRREINAMYRSGLSDIPGLEFMPSAAYGEPNCWLTCVTIDPLRAGCSREDVRLFLESHLIESRPVWKPMHLQPVFQGCAVRGGDVSSRLFENGLCFPSGSILTDSDVERVIRTVRETPGLRC